MSASRLNFNPTAFCALPLVRRAYQALVVGLAVFLLTLVLLHERFRGYLSEVHLAGPPTQGLDLDEAATWLRRADSRVAAVGIPAGEISPKSEIRVTYVSLRPAAAIARLDDLAERWLYQYLPDRLQTYRRSALTDLRNAVLRPAHGKTPPVSNWNRSGSNKWRRHFTRLVSELPHRSPIKTEAWSICRLPPMMIRRKHVRSWRACDLSWRSCSPIPRHSTRR